MAPRKKKSKDDIMRSVITNPDLPASEINKAELKLIQIRMAKEAEIYEAYVTAGDLSEEEQREKDRIEASIIDAMGLTKPLAEMRQFEERRAEKIKAAKQDCFVEIRKMNEEGR